MSQFVSDHISINNNIKLITPLYEHIQHTILHFDKLVSNLYLVVYLQSRDSDDARNSDGEQDV